MECGTSSKRDQSLDMTEVKEVGEVLLASILKLKMDSFGSPTSGQGVSAWSIWPKAFLTVGLGRTCPITNLIWPPQTNYCSRAKVQPPQTPLKQSPSHSPIPELVPNHKQLALLLLKLPSQQNLNLHHFIYPFNPLFPFLSFFSPLISFQMIICCNSIRKTFSQPFPKA